MNVDLLYSPHRSEVVYVEVDDKGYECDYGEWVELMESVEDASVSYSTWYEDGDLNVLIHDYVIKSGEIVSYNQELTD